jgi:hypothetical protein
MRGSEPSLLLGGGFEEAAPSKRYKLGNAKLLWPLCHGDGCVGLSGIYALLNGIRLAIAHKRQLTAPELDVLMRAAFRFLDGRLSPKRATLCGLRVALWRQLVQATAEAVRRQTGVRVFADRLFVSEQGREGAFTVLEEEIFRCRVPMLLFRGGHYTVVSGVTASSLLLFDSGGAWWVSKRVCGVPGDGDHMRHVIYPSSFMALNV